MKQLLITIVAVVLVGCGPSVDEFRKAAFDQDIEAVKQAIAGGVNVNVKNKKEETSLHTASWYGHKEIAKLLITNGADLNAVGGRFGETPLHSATQYDRKEVFELLIEKGAELNAKDRDGETPLHRIAIWGHKEVAELIIEKGADLNARDNEGKTPLHIAAQGQKEIIELLIAKGADLNAKGHNKWTPLDWAIDHKRSEFADLLRKHGGKTGEELKAEGK